MAMVRWDGEGTIKMLSFTATTAVASGAFNVRCRWLLPYPGKYSEQDFHAFTIPGIPDKAIRNFLI